MSTASAATQNEGTAARRTPDVDDLHDVPTTLEGGPAPRNLGLLDQLGMWGNLGMSLLAFAGAIVVLQPLGEPGMGMSG